MPRPRRRGAKGDVARPARQLREESEAGEDSGQEQQHGSLTPSSPRSSSPLLEQPTPRFYDTSFTTHRISPLHIGPIPLDAGRLTDLSHQLRDALVGDVIRGVQVASSADGSILGRSGTLEQVAIRWIEIEPMFRTLGDDAQGAGIRDGDSLRGLYIDLRYERALYAALLLPLVGQDSETTTASTDAMHWTALGPLASKAKEHSKARHFLHLPLLLMRMPAPLKSSVLAFVQTVFDVRVSSLRLGTHTIIRIWESWIRQSGADRESGKMGSKDVVITLRFRIPTGGPHQIEADTNPGIMEGTEHPASMAISEKPKVGLKSVDIFIPSNEVRRWCEFGQEVLDGDRIAHWDGDSLIRRRLAGGKEEEGWGWRTDSGTVQPFTEALAAYLHENISLDLFHPLVSVIKIACAGFVLTEERLKVFTPPAQPSRTRHVNASPDLGVPLDVYRPVWFLMAALAQRAHGQKLETELSQPLLQA